jgi:hypothetical protein
MMSSETSTDRSVTSTRSNDQLQPWQLFLLAALVGATIIVVNMQGSGPAGVVVLSLTVGATAFTALAVFRTIAPLMGLGDDGSEILGGRTKVALEREKTLVLRSIKDLEFDRAMGKVAEQDFLDMAARLRARAAGLLLQLDQGTSYRQEIEHELARRLGRVKADRKAGFCRACKMTNDVDAKFCKSCGKKLEL